MNSINGAVDPNACTMTFLNTPSSLIQWSAVCTKSFGESCSGRVPNAPRAKPGAGNPRKKWMKVRPEFDK